MENAHNLYLHLKQFVGFPSKWIWRSKDWLYRLTQRNTRITQILEETPLQTFSVLCAPFPPFRHFHFFHSEWPLWSLYSQVTRRALARQQTGLVSHCCSCCLPDCMSVRYLMQCLHSGSLCDELKWGWALLIIPAFISTAEYLLMRCLWLCSFPTHLMFLSPSGSNLAISTF